MFRAERVRDKDGQEYLRCPRCGKLFKNKKEYTKHIHRAHIQRMTEKRYVKIRIRKKWRRLGK